jgi:hypothetical protein
MLLAYAASFKLDVALPVSLAVGNFIYSGAADPIGESEGAFRLKSERHSLPGRCHRRDTHAGAQVILEP